MIEETTPDCRHWELQVYKVFDQPDPVSCVECQKTFSLADAVAHIRALETESARSLKEWQNANGKLAYSEHVKHPALVVNYAIAEYMDGDTGEECFAIPDLGIDTTVGEPLNTSEVLHDRVSLAMEERTEQSLLPPIPRDIPELQKLYPSYSDWEWSWLPVGVIDCIAVGHA